MDAVGDAKPNSPPERDVERSGQGYLKSGLVTLVGLLTYKLALWRVKDTNRILSSGIDNDCSFKQHGLARNPN
jgi:hypothetical protein